MRRLILATMMSIQIAACSTASPPSPDHADAATAPAASSSGVTQVCERERRLGSDITHTVCHQEDTALNRSMELDRFEKDVHANSSVKVPGSGH